MIIINSILSVEQNVQMDIFGEYLNIVLAKIYMTALCNCDKWNISNNYLDVDESKPQGNMASMCSINFESGAMMLITDVSIESNSYVQITLTSCYFSPIISGIS